MSKNQQLFKDAIADAKALREVAVANAKAALEESFMPRIQSMFEKRIMESEDELAEMDSELEEKITYEGDKDNLLKSLDENDELEEDLDLEELFNSLSEDDDLPSSPTGGEYGGEFGDLEEEDELEEDYDLEEILRELEEESNEINEEEEDGDLNENTMFEKATGTEDISEVTVDELRDMIQDAIKAVMGGEEGSAGEEEMSMDAEEKDGGEEEDFNFDLGGEEEGGEEEGEEEEKPKKKSKKDELDELFAIYERKKKEVELDERRRYKGEKAELDEKYDKKANAPYGFGKKKDKTGAPYGATGDKKSGLNGAYKNKLSMKLNENEDEMNEDWNAASMSLTPDQLAMLPTYVGGLLASMVAGGAALANKDEIANAVKKAIEKLKGSPVQNEAKEDLEEAVKVIKTLRNQLNEVNLLNAKLIYVNRLFKSNQLTESQKVNVVNSFDKAQSLNEAKNIFEVLKNTVKTTKVAPRTALKENRSFASSVIGGATAKPSIINADDTITRMQKLAGIIKN